MPVVKLYPAKDAYASNLDYSNHNGSTLRLGPSYKLYMQFDVSSIPKDATINYVYLNLYSLTTGKMGGYHVYTCTSEWNEVLVRNGDEPTSVLENNKPFTIWPSVNGWINAIRPLDTVKKHIKGTATNYGFYVDAYENDCEYLEFASKEYSDASKKPYLEIDYSMPLPNTPSNLSPTMGTILDRAKVQRLSWQHNPASPSEQTKFDLQWRLQGATNWNTVSLNTVNQYWDAPVNTFPRGMIEWQNRTYDQYSQASSYSAISLFYAGDKPSQPVITSPASGSLISGPQLTVQWTHAGQTEYDLKLTNTNGNALWEEIKASIDKAKIVGYTLANNTSYKIRLRVKNADGLWSDFAESSINVVYATVPPPVVSITPDAIRGSLKLDIRNEIPPMNLIDGDCEKLDKWISQFGNNVLNSVNKVFGSNSIKYTVTSDNGEHYNQYAGTVTLKPYTAYCISAYIKPVTSKGYLRIVVLKSDYSLDSGAEGGMTGDTAKFTRCFVKLKTGSDPKFPYIRLQLAKSDGTVLFSGVNEAAYFDGVMIHEITEAEYNNASYQPPTFTMNTSKLSFNEVYRRKQGETNWLKLARIDPNTVYIDYTPKHLQTYEYKARAVMETLAYADSNVTLASIELKNSQIALPSDYSKWVSLKFNPAKSQRIEYDRTLMRFAGREDPIAEFTKAKSHNVSNGFTVTRDTLEKLIEIADNRETVLYRDSRGKRLFGTIGAIDIEDDNIRGYYIVKFTVDRVGYIEGV